MNKVLIAVDSIKDSKAVLSVFRNWVRPPDRIILLHVKQLEGNSLMVEMLSDSEVATIKESLKNTEHLERLDNRAEKIISHYKRELENGGLVCVKPVVREGRPAEEILKVAEEEDVDLIVVGCSEKPRLQRFITGCTSRDVQKESRVPVLVAKKAEDEDSPLARERIMPYPDFSAARLKGAEG